jgi:hypothetical protein
VHTLGRRSFILHGKGGAWVQQEETVSNSDGASGLAKRGRLVACGTGSSQPGWFLAKVPMGFLCKRLSLLLTARYPECITADAPARTGTGASAGAGPAGLS